LAGISGFSVFISNWEVIAIKSKRGRESEKIIESRVRMRELRVVRILREI
jgi:hypothetical protein